MELTQEIMDVYTAGATKMGEANWSERDDSAGIQAVLDFLAPAPDRISIAGEAKDRVSFELSEIRTILSRADTAAMAVTGYKTRLADPDPEQLRIVQALRTVVEVLRPWARAGWKSRQR